MFWKSKNSEAGEISVDEAPVKSPEKMFADVTRIREKYPDKVPVVIHVHQSSHSELPPLDKNKFIIPLSFTVAQLLATIRKRINLSAEKALFIFTNNSILASNTTMQDLLSNSKKQYLEFIIAVENTFGWENIAS